jgi:hypothetical protein
VAPDEQRLSRQRLSDQSRWCSTECSVGSRAIAGKCAERLSHKRSARLTRCGPLSVVCRLMAASLALQQCRIRATRSSGTCKPTHKSGVSACWERPCTSWMNALCASRSLLEYGLTGRTTGVHGRVSLDPGPDAPCSTLKQRIVGDNDSRDKSSMCMNMTRRPLGATHIIYVVLTEGVVCAVLWAIHHKLGMKWNREQDCFESWLPILVIWM